MQRKIGYIIDCLKYKLDSYIILWFQKHHAEWLIEQQEDAIFNYILLEMEKNNVH